MELLVGEENEPGSRSGKEANASARPDGSFLRDVDGADELRTHHIKAWNSGFHNGFCPGSSPQFSCLTYTKEIPEVYEVSGALFVIYL